MNSELAAVGRAMRILEVLADDPGGLTVTEICDRLDLNKAMVSRILSTLESSGYVAQDLRTNLFTLTWRLLATAYRYGDSLPFEDLTMPILRELARETGEQVQMAVVQGESLLYVAKVEGVNPLRVASMLGRFSPLHASAAGKVYLASLPVDRALRLVHRDGMARITEHTITDPVILLEQLQHVRAQGYALSREEVNRTVVALAVPVPPDGAPVHVTIVVAVPAYQATETRLRELSGAAKAAAAKMAERLPPW